jgi:hypothetical protein
MCLSNKKQAKSSVTKTIRVFPETLYLKPKSRTSIKVISESMTGDMATLIDASLLYKAI